MMDLVKLKNYLKIDADITDMDDVLTSYCSAAEEYIKNAGCRVDYDNKLCEIIIAIIVAKFVENPDLLPSKNVLGEKAGITVNGLITQLRYAQIGDRK